jgi:hypothetical protein
MAKRSYSEADKAAALAMLDANGGNLKKTATAMGIPQTTLRQWRDGEHVNDDVAKKRDIKNGTLSDLFEQVTRAYLSRALDDDAIKDTRGKDAVIAAATSLDKLRLLQGLPTEIIEIIPSVQQIFELLQARGQDPAAVFNAMLVKLDNERRAK